MNFFENFSGLQKLLIFVLGFIVITFGFFYFTTNFYVAITAFFVIYLALYLTKNIWIAHKNPKLLVAIASLGILSTVALSFGFLQNFLQALLQEVNKKYFHLNIDWENVNPPAYLILGFTIIGITIINYFFSRDNSAMGMPINPIDKDITDRDFKSKFKGVCAFLDSKMQTLDIETNWSIENFIPLDAEVEIITNNKKKRTITDLLGAIKKLKKERTFLVLGEPGSGKSVALRKLCRDLLREEANTVYKIPLYINLKEWALTERWTNENLPTTESLENFILKNLTGRGVDTGIRRFFEIYYTRLYDLGRLYFILDSFDEIPAVLDEKENSKLIKKLSSVIYDFLKGSRDEQSQGILSSRNFRKPNSDYFQTKTTLEIRPFTENKVIESFAKQLNNADDIVNIIFKDKRELSSIVRNPFLASLIIEFIRNHTNKSLPENLSEAYSSYLDKTLKDDNGIESLDEYGLEYKDIIDGAIIFSQEMFERRSLEIPINTLRNKYPNLQIDSIIDILKSCRLGRGNNRDSNKFSFVHRRFAEYFYVQYLIRNPDLVDIKSIPHDSQMRDALVLYCEVGEFSKVKEIADYCWAEITNSKDVKKSNVIHCLRFLSDAFRGRIECIQHFRKDLANFLNDHLHQDIDIISLKIVIESVSLLEEKELDLIISKAMTFDNFWINDVAIKSCRHLNNISKELELKICQHINNMEIDLFFKQYLDYKFSFKLSESFKNVLTLIKIRKFGDVIFTSILSISWLIFIWFSYTYAKHLNNKQDNINHSISFFETFKYENVNLIINFSKNPSEVFFAILAFIVTTISILQFTLVSIISRLYLFFYSFSFTKRKIVKVIIFFLSIISSVYFLPIILTFIFNNKLLYYLLGGALFIFLIIAIIIILNEVISEAKALIMDFMLFKKHKVSFIRTKQEIQFMFEKIKTDYFKEKYISYFENNKSEITGRLSNDFLKVTNNQYITRLAKLEEKWLELENSKNY
jgi:NACHT domain